MKIIGFTGFKQSGKDTAANLLSAIVSPKRVVRIGFADALKDEVCKAFGITREYLEQHKANFRLILQGVGTDYRRKLCGDNYWIVKWLQKVNALNPVPDYLLCTDVRFINEAKTIRSVDGYIVRVTRPAATSDGHASETEQLQIHADVTITNDGSIQDLQEQLKQKLTWLS